MQKELHSLFNHYETMQEQTINWFNDKEISVKYDIKKKVRIAREETSK